MSIRILSAALASALLALLAGCSSGPASDSVTASAAAASASAQVTSPGTAAPGSPTTIETDTRTAVGTGGQLIPIQSDNVQSAGYDDATGTMTVLFDSGGLYEYYDVPPALWTDFIAAQPHPWSAVGDPQLVKGGYRYKRVG